MHNVDDLQKEITSLPAADFSRFRTWFLEYDAQNWDKQFENDVNSGKLEKFASDALKELKNGKCSKL
jgi:hypothetical protein